MTPAWSQRREALLRDCLVSPNVFHQLVERLSDFVVPYQHALEPEVGQRHLHRSLEGLLSHLGRKNAEEIATFVHVERQVMQAFIGTVPWDHRPLVKVLVGQVVARLGEPDGIIACDPSSFPKRGTHSVGVKRQWCGHRGQVEFLIGETQWGQQWTPALTLSQVRYGLSMLLMEVYCPPGTDYICRQVYRQFMRNALARFYPHRARKCMPRQKLRREIQ